MHLDLYVALGALVVGFTVGLTGMGGGALMTPMLVLLFHVQPLAAVSSDLVASMIMKPVGGAVHLRRGTVNKTLAKWLIVGSVPSAFAGVLVLKALGRGQAVQDTIRLALGVTLLVAAASIIAKAFLNLRRPPGGRAGEAAADVPVRPLPTILIGALGGLVVGLTSVGSGSLIIVMLLVLYPGLTAGQLVGTDLVQAVPLVASAALGHLLFGDFKLGLTTSLLLGALPGVYVGARVSSSASGRLIRRALSIVLLASGLKLVGVGNVQLLVTVVVAAAAGPLLWRWVRATGGLRRSPRVRTRTSEV